MKELRFLETAAGRVWVLMQLLAALGTIVTFLWKGAPYGVGFLIGSLIAMVSFRLTHRMVSSIGGPGNSKPQTWKIVLMGSRYVIITAVIYAILNIYGFNIVAALCGLFIAAAAVLLEILYEVIHGTRDSNHPPV